jgi:hypothetical protein
MSKQETAEELLHEMLRVVGSGEKAEISYRGWFGGWLTGEIRVSVDRREMPMTIRTNPERS